MVHDPQADELGDAGAGLKEGPDQEAVLAPITVGHLNEASFFVARQSLHDTCTTLDALNADRPPHFLGDVTGLVVSEVMFASKFGGGRDEVLEAFVRFRFCGWSTHKQVLPAYSWAQKLLNSGRNFDLQAFCEMILKYS